MKYLLAAFLSSIFVTVYAQTVPVQPIEEQYHINYWWWVLGVLLAIGAGIALYMLIKKNPKKDVV